MAMGANMPPAGAMMARYFEKKCLVSPKMKLRRQGNEGTYIVKGRHYLLIFATLRVWRCVYVMCGPLMVVIASCGLRIGITLVLACKLTHLHNIFIFSLARKLPLPASSHLILSTPFGGGSTKPPKDVHLCQWQFLIGLP